ncbi:MAG: hypothetical protein LKM39_17265 [Chiayiivirga sp.]|jgi:hypothetical protein|nr:hypothetical protein [Chiayiivirga sp.]
MNTPNDELELRRRLRQLPPDRAPRRDLWQGIETRLVPPHHARRAPRSWLRPLLALAAVLALALALAWHPAFLRTEPSLVHQPAPGRADPSLRREADAIALEYRFAIDSATPAAMPPELQAAADELDASARQLRDALREQPEATYLLDRLRHTYEQRLRLTRRGVMG